MDLFFSFYNFTGCGYRLKIMERTGSQEDAEKIPTLASLVVERN